MAAGLRDTDPETERVQLELLRRAGPARRLELALSLSRSVMSLSRAGIARSLAGASPEEVPPSLSDLLQRALEGADLARG